MKVSSHIWTSLQTALQKRPLSPQRRKALTELSAMSASGKAVQYDELLKLAARLRVPHTRLTKPWLKYQLTLMETSHPFPQDMGPAQIRLARLVRQALLVQDNRPSTADRLQYIKYRDLIAGNLPIRAATLRKDIFCLLIESGVVTESTARSTIGEYVLEAKARGTPVGPPLDKDTDNEFDHTHSDALSRPRVSIERVLGEDLKAAAEYTDTLRKEILIGNMEGLVDGTNLNQKVRRTVDCLSPQTREIICKKYGIGRDGEMTYEEIGSELGVSGARVNQIFSETLRQLRYPSHSRNLRHFYDEQPPASPYCVRENFYKAVHGLKGMIDPAFYERFIIAFDWLRTLGLGKSFQLKTDISTLSLLCGDQSPTTRQRNLALMAPYGLLKDRSHPPEALQELLSALVTIALEESKFPPTPGEPALYNTRNALLRFYKIGNVLVKSNSSH